MRVSDGDLKNATSFSCSCMPTQAKTSSCKEDHFQLIWLLYRDFGVADQNIEFGNHEYQDQPQSRFLYRCLDLILYLLLLAHELEN